MRSLILACALSACTWQNADRATLASSYAAMTCDYLQTRLASSEGWVNPDGKLIAEQNAFMGSAPNTMTVDAYFITLGVINAAVWLALPEKWRSVWGGAITLEHARVIRGNAEHGFGVCGVRG